MQINHRRLSESEELAVADAADAVYDVLIEKACHVGAGIALDRFTHEGEEQTDEESDYISSIQMEMAKRMIARMLMRSTEI